MKKIYLLPLALLFSVNFHAAHAGNSPILIAHADGISRARVADHRRFNQLKKPAAHRAAADRRAAGQRSPDVTRSRTVERTDDGVVRTQTRTNAEGETRERVAEITRDRENQTFNKDVTITNPEGETRSINRSRERTDDGSIRTQSRTNVDGETSTREVDISRDQETQTITRDVTLTNPEGETEEYSVVKTRGE